MKAADVSPNLVLYGLIAVAAVYAIYNAKKAAGAVADTAKQVITKDLNPASDQNLAYRGVNGVGAAVSGDSSWTLGGWIYDITHPAYGGAASASDTATAPTFTQDQLNRIGGAVVPVDGATGSFNAIKNSNPLDPATWGLGLYS